MVDISSGGRRKVRPPREAGTPGAFIERVVSRQHGVVARQQLLDAGIGASTVTRLMRSRWLRPLHAGVYLVAGSSHTREASWMAAVLAGGKGAVLSHRSAGELWGLLEPIEGPAHVTVRHGRRTDAGIVLHRTRDPTRRVSRRGILATTPTRTILDLAAVLSASALKRVIEAADRHGLLDVEELTHLCETSTGRKGTGRLRPLLAQYRPLPETRSELERHFLRLCREAGLPKPSVNVPVEGLEVDCLWPEQRLVVELDGYAFHGDHASFERDRRRDARLQLAGYRVLRVTHRRLVEQAGSVATDLRTLLGLPN